MKRFSFPLDAALQQRVRQEQAAQLALAHAAAEHAAATARLDELERERAAVAHSMTAQGETLDVEGRMNALYYVERCALSIEQQGHAVRQREDELGQARAQLVDAAARKRALERLRERRKAEYDARLNRLLDSQLDELVTVRHGRAIGQGEQLHADY